MVIVTLDFELDTSSWRGTNDEMVPVISESSPAQVSVDSALVLNVNCASLPSGRAITVHPGGIPVSCTVWVVMVAAFSPANCLPAEKQASAVVMLCVQGRTWGTYESLKPSLPGL